MSAPTSEPADVPMTTSAVPRSTPASKRPASTPISHAIPVTPPPPRTSARPLGIARRVPPHYGRTERDREERMPGWNSLDTGANDAMTCTVVEIAGAGGDKIHAYVAKPEGNGPFPGVVLINHAPGWDELYR